MPPGITVWEPSPPAIRWSGDSRWHRYEGGRLIPPPPGGAVRKRDQRPADARQPLDGFWVVLGLDPASGGRWARRSARLMPLADEIKERFGLGLCGAVAAPAGSQTGLLIQCIWKKIPAKMPL